MRFFHVDLNTDFFSLPDMSTTGSWITLSGFSTSKNGWSFAPMYGTTSLMDT